MTLIINVKILCNKILNLFFILCYEKCWYLKCFLLTKELLLTTVIINTSEFKVSRFSKITWLIHDYFYGLLWLLFLCNGRSNSESKEIYWILSSWHRTRSPLWDLESALWMVRLHLMITKAILWSEHIKNVYLTFKTMESAYNFIIWDCIFVKESQWLLSLVSLLCCCLYKI